MTRTQTRYHTALGRPRVRPGLAAGGITLALLAGLHNGAWAAEGGGAAFDTDAKKASYSIGYSMAANLRREFGDDLDLAALKAGLEDQLSGASSRVSEADANAAFQALIATRQAAAEVAAQENVAAGAAFLAENGKREGVITLPSGLQYEVLVAAEGAKPGPADQVTTHYRGTLIDGTQFDSSYDRGQPATFPLNGVIAGWTEALQLMAPGAKWRLYIPPELAYGSRAQGPIPGNSTLIFDVELLEIK
ncbi:MAG TPA: FKBP-type peptidyl-prolyl cis-trans isomerase [Pseudomonadales bacterium]